MLNIVKYILTHDDWRERLTEAPYSLTIHDNGRYTIFSYNMIESDFHEPICSEARGLILDREDNFRVVRMAFTKFFNIDEPFAATIDWSTATASEKIDGSIMSVWYDNNEWHISTNNCIDAKEVPTRAMNMSQNNKINYVTFYDLFMQAVKNAGLDFDKLNKNYCYTFELVSPENRVVIPYSETKIYHLLTRDMTDLSEVITDIGVEKPKVYPLVSETDIRNTVSQLGNDHEGVVVCDANHNRVKIKTETYFLMHKVMTGFTFEGSLELVFANDYQEFVSYFKQYKDYFDCMKMLVDQIKDNALRIEEKMAYLHNCYTRLYQPSKYVEGIIRTRFAKALSKTTLFDTYMLAYDLSLVHYTTNPINVQSYIRLTRRYWLKFAEMFPEFVSTAYIMNI